jgi:16S rRNA (guanine(966)-N(2))-methyltransferase RsmD
MARRKQHRPKSPAPPRTQRAAVEPVGLRIIGGALRGRRLRYSGDPAVRPMKDRVREAVFNLLGPAVRGKCAVDLFAGTGALGLESLSRGAARAVFLEQHFPTGRLLADNNAALDVAQQAEVVTGNVFLRTLWEGRLSACPWLVFSSPPYAFYVDRKEEMLDLLGHLIEAAPEESVFIVESDERFDFRLLPDPGAWDIRSYSPAVIGIYRKPATCEP